MPTNLARTLEAERRKHVYGGLYLNRTMARKVIALLRAAIRARREKERA